MSIDINNESGQPVNEGSMLRLVRYLMEHLHLHPRTELSILLVAQEAMERLHREHLDEPGATDVISIPMDNVRPGRPGQQASPGLLGDVVICPQVAGEQAQAGGHSVDDEILLLLTHGLLHLVGYDHDTPEDRSQMFSLQRTLLGDFLGRPAPVETEQ